ncbi:ankyrin repeat-containing protein BDA1-like [Mangifera indica]|uniref:ankyrin repeat-containing protein BDA1-like n=1 Tax=Mangifera indica TaxID=29780 RepID=UPI001CFBC994|nr:ankyrin repeat-containing protein BDA1-like [Mangifera indica]
MCHHPQINKIIENIGSKQATANLDIETKRTLPSIQGQKLAEKLQKRKTKSMEMEIIAESDTQMLYEASMRGCVATLNTLIQNDPLILHKISLTPFTETPLHISALLGHVEFTKAIVSQKPQLVTELDSFERSPLHLAAAEGHSEIVKELLIANKDVSMVADQEGRIPLHLAAMRGRVEVIKELITAKPESILVQIHGETALHLCVKHNHLDALKVLVSSVDDVEFLNSKNLEGNSILQLSTILRQYETTRYLLSVRKIRVDLNSLTKNGLPAFDGICRNGSIQRNLQNNPTKETATKDRTTKVQTTQSLQKLKSIWRRLCKHKSDRYEKTRGNLMVVAILMATMSFQIATNPPGGNWQADTTSLKGEGCPEGVTCPAGTSIHAYTHKDEYNILTIVSTISFSASLGIILWLISGVPLRNRVSEGILRVGMWVTVLCIAGAYYLSMSLVLPHDEIFLDISMYYEQTWVYLLMGILFIHAIRFCCWVLKKLFTGVIFVAKRCCFKKKKQLDQPVVSV